jgi:hypothetical protein
MKYQLIKPPGNAWDSIPINQELIIIKEDDRLAIYIQGVLKFTRDLTWVQSQLNKGNIRPIQKLLKLPDWW